MGTAKPAMKVDPYAVIRRGTLFTFGSRSVAFRADAIADGKISYSRANCIDMDTGQLVEKRPLRERIPVDECVRVYRTNFALFNTDRAQVAALAKGDKPAEPDVVKNPQHYAQFKIQPIDFLMQNEVKGHVFNIVKYVMRAGRKLYPSKTATESEIIDLEKVIDYAEKRIRQLKGEPICLP